MIGADTLKFSVAKVTRYASKMLLDAFYLLSIKCGQHAANNNGAVSGDTFYGGSPTVICNNGYTQTGSVSCGDDDNWVTDVQCDPVGEFNVR